MAERKPGRLDDHRPVRRMPDDYAAPADEEDIGQEYAEEDAEDDDALGAAAADTQPDVLLDVPTVKVEEIHLEVEDLTARVSLQAEVLSLLKLHVGAEVSLGHVSLDIKGVDAVAQLKVRLDKVEAIIDRVMTTVDNNPQILSDLTRGAGEAAGQIGQGAGQALEETGAGAGAAVESAGRGLQEAAEDLGQGADRAVEEVVDDTGGVADDTRPGIARSPRRDRPTRRDRRARPQ
jgi:hypothetical protein